MYIERLKKEGNAWKARLQFFNSEKRRLVDEHDKAIADLNNEIVSSEKSIRDFEAQAVENEKKILPLTNESYINAVCAELDSILSVFGITYSETDRSAELEKAIKTYESALKGKKRAENKLSKCKNDIVDINNKFDNDIASLRATHAREKQALIDKLVPEYSLNKSRCLKNYSITSKAPSDSAKIPEKLVISNQKFDVDGLNGILPETSIKVPYEVDVRNAGNFAINIKTDDVFNIRLERVIVGMILRYIEAFPATKLHLGMFNATISSNSMLEALYRAMDEANCTILDSVVDSKMDIKKLLDRIDVCSNGAGDKMIRNGCRSIYELYDTGKDTMEPFHLIVLYGALSEISDENITKLYSLMSGSHKKGFRFIIIDDFSAVNSRNSKNVDQYLKQIEKLCLKIEFNAGAPTINAVPSALACMTSDFDASCVYTYCTEYLAKKSAPPYLSYEEIGFGKDKKDPADYDKISIPVGKVGANVWSIGFSCKASVKEPVPIANLILGVPGTGKTKLIDAMIYNAAIKYSPSDVIFHLLDFKDGSMSKGYLLDENKIPHVKVVSAKNDADEASFILSNILEENRARVEEFNRLAGEYGLTIDSIAEYNKTIDEKKLKINKMPRLIIAIDECQTLFATDALANMAEDVVRKGRSQGIHLLLATQALTSDMKKTIKFVDGLYIFQSDKGDIEALLDKKYHDRVNDEAPKGSYSAFASNDAGKSCEKVRVSFYGPKLADYATKIRDKWKNYPCDIIQIGKNDKLEINDINYQQILLATGHFNVALGENYQNRQNAFFSMKQEKLSATLLLGGSEELGTSLSTSVMLSAIRSKSPIYAIDVSQMQSLARIKSECFPNDSSISVGAGKDYKDYLTNIYKIYLERQSIRNEKPSAIFEPVTFIVNGAHEISDFIKEERYEIEKEPSEQENASPRPYENDAPSLLDPVDFGASTDKEEIDLFAPIDFGASTDEEEIDLFAPVDFGSSDDDEERETVEPRSNYNARRTRGTSIEINARETLLELIEKGKKLGIYICIWIDGTDNSVERKAYNDNCGVKVIFPNFKSNVSSYMNDAFNEKMITKINNNMALVEHSVEGIRVLKKLRVFQYNLDDKKLIDFIKKL